MSADRRRAMRKNLQPGEYIVFSAGSGGCYVCPVLDISTLGMMVYAPGFGIFGLNPDDDIVIGDCPPHLTLLKNRQGNVVWSRGDTCGIRFDAELGVSGKDLHRLLRDRNCMPGAAGSGRSRQG